MSNTSNLSALTSPAVAASPLTPGAAKASDLMARHTSGQDFGQALARSLSTAQHNARREQAAADNKNAEARRMDGRRADASRADASRAEANRSQAKGTQQAEPAPGTHQAARAERAGKPDKARAHEGDEAGKLNAPDAALGLLDWRGPKTGAKEVSASELRTNPARTGSDAGLGLASAQVAWADVNARSTADISSNAATQGAEKPGRTQGVEETTDPKNGRQEPQGLQALGVSQAANEHEGISETQALPETQRSSDDSLERLENLQGTVDSQPPASVHASAPGSSLSPAPTSTATLNGALGAAGPSNHLLTSSSRATAHLAAASGAAALSGGRAVPTGLTGKAAASAVTSALASAPSTESTAFSASSTFGQTATGLVPNAARAGSTGNVAGSDSSLFSPTLNATSAAAEPSASDTLFTANTQPSASVWAPLEPEVGSPAWHQALSQQVMHMRAGDVNEAQLQLNPAGLGPLRIKLSLRDQQIDAEFSAAHAQVRAALEAALPQLRETLQQGGMQLGQAWVEPPNAQAMSRNTGNMGHMSDGGRQAHDQAAQDGSEGSRESARVSLAGRTSLSNASSAASVLAGVTGGHGPGQRLNTFA